MHDLDFKAADGGIEDPYLKQHLAKLKAFEEVPSRARRTGIFRAFRSIVNDQILSHINPKARILDIGCGDGSLLARAGSPTSLGIDVNENEIFQAQQHSRGSEFISLPAEKLRPSEHGSFDAVVMSGVIEQVYDVHTLFSRVLPLCHSSSRLVIVTYSKISQPLLRIAEALRLRHRSPVENWVPPSEVKNLLEQNDFEVIEEKQMILLPVGIPLVTAFVNRWLAPLPGLRLFCLASLLVARPRVSLDSEADPSVSVVVAARNERGNINQLLERIPELARIQQVIFVEGGSEDGTFEEILAEKSSRESNDYPFEIIALRQPGVGKADAVRTGFDAASGDILIILDADLSVPPEELPRFIEVLKSGSCEFANGSRLVYPMEEDAMRFLNLLGNRFFGTLFTYLLGQPVRDTLCGTKALWASDYQRIVDGRSLFGDFDPFGDFDLLFGAARLGLRIRDVPVHYKERTYGSTNISRFRHGLLLLKMSLIAARRLKFR